MNTAGPTDPITDALGLTSPTPTACASATPTPKPSSTSTAAPSGSPTPTPTSSEGGPTTSGGTQELGDTIFSTIDDTVELVDYLDGILTGQQDELNAILAEFLGGDPQDPATYTTLLDDLATEIQAFLDDFGIPASDTMQEVLDLLNGGGGNPPGGGEPSLEGIQATIQGIIDLITGGGGGGGFPDPTTIVPTDLGFPPAAGAAHRMAPVSYSVPLTGSGVLPGSVTAAAEGDSCGGATATPTPTPTATKTASPTPAPTATATLGNPSPKPSATPEPTETVTASPEPTVTASSTPAATTSPAPSPAQVYPAPQLSQTHSSNSANFRVQVNARYAGLEVYFFRKSGQTGKVQPLGTGTVNGNGTAFRTLNDLKPGQTIAAYAKIMNADRIQSPYSNTVTFTTSK